MLFICEVILKDVYVENDEKGSQFSFVDQSILVDLNLEFLLVIFFDVVVLKCLLLIGWDENGVVWVLCYFIVYFKREFNFCD